MHRTARRGEGRGRTCPPAAPTIGCTGLPGIAGFTARALTLAALLLTAAGSAPAGAQAPAAALPARATLLDADLTGTGIQNLDFGSLRPGDVVAVTPGPASAGQPAAAGWRFTGLRKGRTVVWTFLLPAALSRGAHSLPIDWDNPGYGTLCISRNDGACDISSTFNPGAAAIQLTIPNNTPGNNYDATVYVGATAIVPALPPGTYTAQASIFMAYLF